MTTPNEARPEWKPVAWIRRDHLRHAQKAAFYCALSATQLQPDQEPLYGPAVHTEMLRAQEEARVLREALARLQKEMQRYLPILLRAEDSGVWDELAAGTGIATTNGYIAALKGTP